MSFVTAVAYQFYLNLPAAFSQPGNSLIEVPCTCPPKAVVHNYFTKSHSSSFVNCNTAIVTDLKPQPREGAAASNSEKDDLQCGLTIYNAARGAIKRSRVAVGRDGVIRGINHRSENFFYEEFQ